MSSEKNFVLEWIKRPEFTPDEVRVAILSTPDIFESASGKFHTVTRGGLFKERIDNFEVTYAFMLFTRPGLKADGITALWYCPVSERVFQIILTHRRPKREMERFIRSFSSYSVSYSNDRKNSSTPQTKEQSTSSDEWAILNRWLDKFYQLPLVRNEEQLKSAAWLVSELWFKEADKAVRKLEANGIPWERTAPFLYLFDWYIRRDIKLRNASNPIEFMAADHALTGSVRDLHNCADELILMKETGEPLKIFPTEESAREWYKDLEQTLEQEADE
jgi:hypothetical protein